MTCYLRTDEEQMTIAGRAWFGGARVSAVEGRGRGLAVWLRLLGRPAGEIAAICS